MILKCVMIPNLDTLDYKVQSAGTCRSHTRLSRSRLAMLIPTSSRRHRGSHLSPCVHPRRRPRCIPQSAHKLSVPWRHCARLDGVIVPGSTASLCPAFIQTDVPPAFVFFLEATCPKLRERGLSVGPCLWYRMEVTRENDLFHESETDYFDSNFGH